MVVVVREHRLQTISLRIPDCEHALIAQVLLERAEHVFARLIAVRRGAALDDGAQQLGVDQKLARVEHRPPVGKTVALADVAVGHAGHEAERHLLARPPGSQVALPALLPFARRGVEAARVADRGEEAAAVGAALLGARGAVALHRVGGDRAGRAGRLDRGQHVLHRAAGAASEARLGRHRAAGFSREKARSGLRAGHLLRQHAAHFEQAQTRGAGTVPADRCRRVVGYRPAVARAVLRPPGFPGQPLGMDQQRQFDLLAPRLAVGGEYALALTAVRATHRKIVLPHRVRGLRLGHDQRDARRHARVLLLHVELGPAARTAVRPRVHGERLHRHHRTGDDRRAVAAAGHLAGAVLGPEHVHRLRAVVAVAGAPLRGQRQRIEVRSHHLAGGAPRPGSGVAARTLAGVERHDLRADFRLDVGEQRFHLGALDVRKLVLHHEPGDRVEIGAVHLHAEADALDDGGAAAHEQVGYLEMRERAPLPVIAVVGVPHPLGRVRRIVGRPGRGGDQQRPEHAGPAPRPPFRHLVDRLAGVALDGGDLIDRQNRKVDLQAGRRPAGVGKVDRRQRRRLPGAHRGRNLGGQAFRFRRSGARHFQVPGASEGRDSSMNGTATSSSDNPPWASVG